MLVFEAHFTLKPIEVNEMKCERPPKWALPDVAHSSQLVKKATLEVLLSIYVHFLYNRQAVVVGGVWGEGMLFLTFGIVFLIMTLGFSNICPSKHQLRRQMDRNLPVDRRFIIWKIL
jgi:hypothetical protein